LSPDKRTTVDPTAPFIDAKKEDGNHAVGREVIVNASISPFTSQESTGDVSAIQRAIPIANNGVSTRAATGMSKNNDLK
jgi:hypothetical protein